jgi:hypothetical protein
MGGSATIDYEALAKQYGGTTTKKASLLPAPSSVPVKKPIDYAALAKQFGGTSTSAPTSSSTADLIANPKGEGLYRMGSYDFHEGQVSKPEISVPYSKVQDAQAAGYKLHPDEEPRYQKDSTHEGQGPTLLERAGKKINEALEPSTGAVGQIPVIPGLDVNAVKAAGRAIAATPGYFRDLAQTAVDVAANRQSSSALLDMVDPGQMPEQMYRQFQSDYKKDPKLAADNLVGTLAGLGVVAAATHGAEKLGGRVLDKIPEHPFQQTAQNMVGTGQRAVRGEVEAAAEKANKTYESTKEANRKADEATLEARGKVDEANRKQALDDDLARREAEEKTLKARGVVDEANQKAVEQHKEEVRKAEEATLKARGAIDDFNRESRLAAKAEARAAQKAADANEPYLEKDQVYTSARQAHDAAVDRQIEIEGDPRRGIAGKWQKLSDQLESTRQAVYQRVKNLRDAARAYFYQAYGDIEKAAKGKRISLKDLSDVVTEAKKHITGSDESVKAFNDIEAKVKGLLDAEDEDIDEQDRAQLAPDEQARLSEHQKDTKNIGPDAALRDVEGYYSELGRLANAKGTAPDVKVAAKAAQQGIDRLVKEKYHDEQAGAVAYDKAIDAGKSESEAMAASKEAADKLYKQILQNRARYRGFAQGFLDADSPVTKIVKGRDYYKGTKHLTDSEGQELATKRDIKKTVVGDAKDSTTQFVPKDVATSYARGPNGTWIATGDSMPGWRYRRQAHQQIEHLRDLQRGLDALPSSEKLAKEVDDSDAVLATARERARAAAGKRPVQKEYPQPVATPPTPTPKPYPEPEGTPPVTSPKEYAEPHATTPVETPEVDTRKIREGLLNRWASGEEKLNPFQVRSLIRGGLGPVLGGLFGEHFGGGAGGVVGAVAGTALGPAMIAKFVDLPRVREWLTRPPVEELETLRRLPHADRVKIADGLRETFKEATAQGKPIKMAPSVITFIAANGTKRGGDKQP